MSVDNILDFDADSVSVIPWCGKHDVPLDNDGTPKLAPEKDNGFTEWFVDLSEFACPRINAWVRLRTYEQERIDKEYEEDNNSWYMKVTIKVR